MDPEAQDMIFIIIDLVGDVLRVHGFANGNQDEDQDARHYAFQYKFQKG